MKIRLGRNTVAVVTTVVALAMLALSGANGRAQGLPVVLQITSPTDGTVVNPGQVVTVVVAATQGATFSKVFLIGEHPIGVGMNQVFSAPPYQFAVTIPRNISSARTYIRAMGVTPGQPGGTVAIHLDVEPSVSISSISVRPALIQFDSVGDKIPLKVSGTFSDGSIMDITKSSRTTYSAGDPSVATVNGTGLVTAANPASRGYAVIVVKYGDQTASVPVSTTRIPPGTP